MEKEMFICPQCGDDTETLHEGYCERCRTANQLELNGHIAQVEAWDRLTDEERRARIRAAWAH